MRNQTPARPRHYAPGDVVLAQQLTTIQSERIRLPAPEGLTHLQFRRYAGCPVCNLHLRSIARRHDELVAAGLREVAVFHSPAAQLRPHQADLPFPVVADPGRELYAAFGVETSIRAVLHPRPLSTPLNPRSWAVVASSTDDGDRPSHTLATSSQARSISRSYVRL
jgi:peroxiredoxin